MALDLVPYIACSRQSLPHFQLGQAPFEVTRFLIEQPDDAAFFSLLLRANRMAFTGTTELAKNTLTLPEDVLLGCYLLGNAVIGFAQRAASLPPDVYRSIDPPSPDVLVPVSGFAGMAAPIPGVRITVSLFALVQQQVDLRLRTKALALLLFGAERSVGIAQFGNSSLGMHTLFGPLRLDMVDPPAHTMSFKTFVYEQKVPEVIALRALATATKRPMPPTNQPKGQWRPVDKGDDLKASKSEISARPGQLAVVHPGVRTGMNGPEMMIAELPR